MQNIGELFDLNRKSSRLLPPDGICVTVHGQNKPEQYLSFSIGNQMMIIMRWLKGDKVTIDFDCAKSEATIRRVGKEDKQGSMWTLSGKTTEGATVFKIKATPIMLKAFGMEDCEQGYVPTPLLTSQNGITFPLRKQWTVRQQPSKR